MASNKRPTSLKMPGTSERHRVLQSNLSVPANTLLSVDEGSEDGKPSASPTRRKLSESRGVQLPNIKINTQRGNSTSTESNDETVFNENLSAPTAPLTATSPIGTVMRRVRIDPATPLSGHGSGVQSNLLELTVFLSDNRGIKFLVENGRQVDAAHMCELVCEHLHLTHSIAQEAMALWMVSPLLEVQLKPHHIPFEVRRVWPALLQKYILADADTIICDEPLLMYKRNVLMSKRRQRMIAHREEALVKLLYIEAREAIILNQCLCSIDDAVQLAAVDMALQLGKYDKDVHTPAYIRNSMGDFMAKCHANVARSRTLFGVPIKRAIPCRTTSLPLDGSQRADVDERHMSYEDILIAKYIQCSDKSTHDLRLKYLDICMQLPYYGCATFTGHVEKRVSLLQRLRDDRLMHVRVCVSREFICIIDIKHESPLLVQPLLDCQWQTQRPTENLPEDLTLTLPLYITDLPMLPSFILNFVASPSPDDGTTCLLEIFTRQAAMIEALVTDREINETIYSITENNKNDSTVAEDSGTEPVQRLTDEITANFLDDRLPADSPLFGRKCAERLSKVCTAHLNSAGQCLSAEGHLSTILIMDDDDVNTQTSHVVQ